jgi:hypothetical protein
MTFLFMLGWCLQLFLFFLLGALLQLAVLQNIQIVHGEQFPLDPENTQETACLLPLQGTQTGKARRLKAFHHDSP